LEGGPKLGQIPRGISIPRTSYSVIGQSRPVEEAVMWFAVDTPATSVYVPFYPAAGGAHAAAYSTGTLLDFTRKSAFWAFDFVANWASLANWRHASEHFVLPLRSKLQDDIQKDMKVVEVRAKKEGPEVLAEWQVETQQRVVDRWWQLADELIVAYNDGNFNNATSKKIGSSFGYPEWFARQIGFNQDVHPIFVKRDWSPEETCAQSPDQCDPSFQGQSSPLPAGYNFATATWLYGVAGHFSSQLSTLSSTSATASGAASQLFSSAFLLLLGVAAGRLYERRQACQEEAPYLQLVA